MSNQRGLCKGEQCPESKAEATEEVEAVHLGPGSRSACPPVLAEARPGCLGQEETDSGLDSLKRF